MYTTTITSKQRFQNAWKRRIHYSVLDLDHIGIKCWALLWWKCSICPWIFACRGPRGPAKVQKEILFLSAIVMDMHVAECVVRHMLFSYFLGLAVLSDTYFVTVGLPCGIMTNTFVDSITTNVIFTVLQRWWLQRGDHSDRWNCFWIDVFHQHQETSSSRSPLSKPGCRPLS